MYHDTYVWMGTASPLILLIAGLLALFIHFLPSYIAISRNHPNSLLIFILNIFFGWTGLGWLILLIWSLARHTNSIFR